MFKFLKRKKDKNSEAQTPLSDTPNVNVDQNEGKVEPQLESPQELEKEPPHSEEPASQEAEPKKSFFSRLRSSLSKTRNQLTSGLANLFLGKKELDDELVDEIETLLIRSDVGMEATEAIIEEITTGISRKEIKDPQAVMTVLKHSLLEILKPCDKTLSIDNQKHTPYVILMVGVNGSGKTTTIGKLAKTLQQQGKKVMLAAGDTFRAAAVEQLQVWGMRNNVPVIAQHTGADSASVIYDAFAAAKSRGMDVLIADTAGRLHTRENLMEELKKVLRVLKKLDSSAPHETMLVLDAGIGQNALVQAEKFHEAINLTGITLTKIDGTAKGGILFAIAKKLKLPLRYLGCGEKIDDLREFNADEFIDALFTMDENREH